MKEILAFFKKIFMISDENSNIKVGLSQLKEVEQKVQEVQKPQKEVKLSDLMRRSA